MTIPVLTCVYGVILGLVLSICLPVTYPDDEMGREALQGVTCVDMTLSDLIQTELQTQQAYIFIFNKNNGKYREINTSNT